MIRPPLRLVTSSRERPVVIVGAGFGGLAAARALGRSGVSVTLIDRTNHHLFQPLLYQVATAALSPADIAQPIRALVRDLPSVRVLMDEVMGVDVARQTVTLASGGALPYEALILATGARHGYFGRDDWAGHARGIKTLDDALCVRRDVLLALEREETQRQREPAARHVPVTFAIVGGGPTGVEMAGAIAELARQAAGRDFPHISRDCIRVVLIEGGERLLAAFPPDSSAAARRGLEALGVEVRLTARVTAIDAEGLTIGGDRLPAAVTIWAAGVQASPAARWLGVQADRSGRVPVTAQLEVAGRAHVYAIGDTAALVDRLGCAVPGVAAAAKQQGEHVAQVVISRTTGRTDPTPFRYRDHGKLATIGRSHAVADLGRIHLSGHAAWLLWSTVHLWFLAGFRHRLSVASHWAWSWITHERGARLITGHEPSAAAVTMPYAAAN